MNFDLSGIAVESLAWAEPPMVVTSAAIEERLRPLYERLRLPEGRLELMTGIRERRFWPMGTLPSHAAAAAGRLVLERSRLPKDEVDAVIHCGVCRDRLEPATASTVHHLLELGGHCESFDLSNACLGVLSGIQVAGALIQAGQARSVLLVSGENGLPLLEHTLRTLLESDLNRNTIKPYFANLTIGGGAVGLLLCDASRAGEAAIRLGRGTVMTDSQANALCQGDSAGEELSMMTDSEALLKAGVVLASRTWEAFRAHTGWDADTPQRVICHQVGRRHQLALFEALGIDAAKDFSTFATWGNVGSVSLPLTLGMARKTGALKAGEPAALLGIGSGLVCMMLEAR
jgi:3-oxoacyl-[acyl-carrier-protein] synthase III